ncbi:MAG: DUF1893 domain-containing protein [Clostridiales bacterium]|jgi:hypothetical protein|nr:DUF1893 domain-containing protein [Clostridiales bacterium]
MNDQQMALHTLLKHDAACAAARQGNVEYSKEKGIKPLLNWLECEKSPLKQASVADKVVGKAAALLFAYGGVSHLHALVISEPAAKALEELSIPFEYEKRVPYIINRTRTGMCPMEKQVLEISDPQRAYQVLRQLVKEL